MTLVSPRPTSERGTRQSRALPRTVAFWTVAVTTAVVPAASSAPSPLYAVYQAEFRFSALTLTVIFAVYVFALMMSLLTVGRLSDFVGRRVVLASALIVEAGAMALFLGADGVGWLLLARVIQGFGQGPRSERWGHISWTCNPAMGHDWAHCSTVSRRRLAWELARPSPACSLSTRRIQHG